MDLFNHKIVGYTNKLFQELTRLRLSNRFTPAQLVPITNKSDGSKYNHR